MSKIDINAANINSNIFPYLKDAISYTNSVVERNNYTSVPSDFDKKSEFENYERELRNLKKDMDDFSSWLSNSIKKENDTENKSYNYANILPDSRVIVRQTVIK